MDFSAKVLPVPVCVRVLIQKISPTKRAQINQIAAYILSTKQTSWIINYLQIENCGAKVLQYN